ncbi:hypothetical protein [Deinococcus sp. YIM 77859]|uniref:hypothetical protein n=1 Tax=Deinococcus sp. YIM 77859 TaxID=1540221 RepID=UPI000552C564|nr:hypothetical protein [Deinococcus sp. YIM 77859]
MKRVSFEGEGDLMLTMNADFSDEREGGVGRVRVQAEGIDVDSADGGAAIVYGWFTPEEAREIARYLNEMADRAEKGGAQ